MNKPTAITMHRTSEGERLAVLYSTIDADGNIVATNQQKGMVLLNEEILSHVEAITSFVNTWLNKGE